MSLNFLLKKLHLFLSDVSTGRMDIIQLSSVIRDVSSTVRYLRDNKLLKNSYTHCGKECLELFHKSVSDNLIFRCRRCRKKFSIRQDSIFSKSKLKLQHLVVLLYAFSSGFSVTQAKKLLKEGVSEHSIIQWYTYLREICSLSLLYTPIQLGHNGSVVKIDEVFIGAKRKYGRGYHRGISECIFGMLDVTTKQAVLRLVPNIKTETLVPIIKEYCVHNTEIHSDEAAMYRNLTSDGFIHKTVCHQDNFVGPDGVHTNDIESFWGHLKNHFRKMNGTNRNMLPLHVDEYMYRNNNKLNGDIYDIFVRDIAKFYRV